MEKRRVWGRGTTKDRDFIRNTPDGTLLSNVASRTLGKLCQVSKPLGLKYFDMIVQTTNSPSLSFRGGP